MIIAYPNLAVHWHNPKRGICGVLENIPDIENGKYGYDLTGGQTVYFIGYIMNGAPYHYNVHIKEVNENGVVIDDWGWDENLRTVGGDPVHNCFENFMQRDGTAFLPWSAKNKDGNPVNLEIVPCDTLKDKLSIKELISGDKDNYTDQMGTGIWHRHGGWRTHISQYAGNIKNFVKLGQMELPIPS